MALKIRNTICGHVEVSDSQFVSYSVITIKELYYSICLLYSGKNFIYFHILGSKFRHPSVHKLIEGLIEKNTRSNAVYVRLKAGEEVNIYSRPEYRSRNDYP